MAGFSQVFLPLLAGTFVMSGITLAARWGLKGVPSPLPFLVMGFTLVAASLSVLYVARWGFALPAMLLPGFWTAVFVGTAANYAIQFFNAKAVSIQSGEASFVAPLAAMTPGLVTLLALMLGEVPGPRGLAGIVLMAAGSWVLLFPHKPQVWWEYLGPLYRLGLVAHYKILSAEDKNRALVVWLAFGSAVFGTVGLVCDGLYTRRGVDMQGLLLALAVLTGLLALGYMAQLVFTHTEWNTSVRADRRFILALALWVGAWVVHLLLVQPVYLESYIAYVGTLKRMSVLITIVLAYFIFKEGDFKRRLGAGMLVVLGALLIGLEDLPARLTSRIELFGL